MYEARNVLRQNQSHPLARDDNAVDNDRHGEKSKLRFISGENPFVPGHRDPTVPVTQCNGLCHVTLSVMHLRNEASASSSRNQTTYPQNDAVLGVAPNQTARSVATGRCSTALTWAFKCAETEPEPSSRTGRRCGRQRRTWQTQQNSIYFRRKPFYTGSL